VEREKDPFAAQCKNAPPKVNQTLCRKEQQMIYLALRQAQHAVDAITEDDILEGALKDLKVLYLAGEWVDHRIIPKLEEWVKAGGVLYCSAGCGQMNQYGEAEPAMLKLLGVKETKLAKNAYHLRTLMELPLCEPIDTIAFGEAKAPAVAMRQTFAPDQAKVIAKWSDGGAAATEHALGKGRVIAVGTVIGTSYMKSGLRPTPFARGGRHVVYNPTNFDATLTQAVRLGVASIERPAVSSVEGVESIVLDHKDGMLLTLVNWTNEPLKEIEVQVRMQEAPKKVRSVSGQREIPFTAKDGVVTFKVPLSEADYVLLSK
jgi:hypothetical protein